MGLIQERWVIPLDHTKIVQDEIIITDNKYMIHLDSVVDSINVGLNCFHHPSTSPIHVCSRCGRLICIGCCKPYFGDYYCKDCDREEFMIFAAFSTMPGFKTSFYAFCITNRHVVLIPISNMTFGEKWLAYAIGGPMGSIAWEDRKKEQAKKKLSTIDFSKILEAGEEGLIMPLESLEITSLRLKKGWLSFTHAGKTKTVLLDEGADKLIKILNYIQFFRLEEAIRKTAGYLEKLEEEWKNSRITDRIYESLKEQYELKLIELYEDYKKKTP